MISRWRIDESPAARDPGRRLLLIKGTLADVHGLIRRLGAVCGRPKKEKEDHEFNFSLFLHQLNPASLQEIEAELRGIAGEPAAAKAAPSPGSGGIPAPAPETASSYGSPEGGIGSENAAAHAPLEPRAGPAKIPAPSNPPFQAQTSFVGGGAPGAPSAGGPPSSSSGGDDGGFVSLFDTPAAPAPAPEAGEGPFAGLQIRAPAEPQPPASSLPETGTFSISLTAPKEPSGPAPVPAGSAPGDPSAERPLFGALLPMDPGHTLENLLVGPFNRFAHAAATQVVTGPGNIYNPLFISGPPGSGKSHLLHAIGLKLAEQFPGEAILMTSGACLAQGVAAAAQSGRLQELFDFAGKSKALIIDDFHMTAVSEQNQAGLAKLLKLYLGSGRQVVLGSVYQPKLLGALEGPLELRLSSGHAVEIKQPGDEKQKEICRQALGRAGFTVDADDASMFADGLRDDFSRLETSVRRLKALSALKEAAGISADLKASLGAILAPESPPAPATAEELRTLLVKEGALPDGIQNAAVLFPKGHEAHADWAWRQLQVVARSCGWKFAFRRMARKPYETEPVFGAPFVVAEECRRAGVIAALVVGPPPGTDLAEHERDFRYALEHLLRDMAINLGWAQCSRIKDPKMYTMAYLDMVPLPEKKR